MLLFPVKGISHLMMKGFCSPFFIRTVINLSLSWLLKKLITFLSIRDPGFGQANPGKLIAFNSLFIKVSAVDKIQRDHSF